jgi:uncharacterized protein
MMYEATSFECSRIAQDLQIRKLQVEAVVQLLNEGNTVPFIARFRKEATGGIAEDVIRQIQTRLNFLKSLNDRKLTIIKSIENKGRLTAELRREILHAPTIRRLEDLFLAFKPRKKALANAAIEKGLEPLALAIWHSDPAVGNLDELLPALVNPEKGLNTPDDVKTGVQHIIAELINETAEVRAEVRRALWKTSTVAATRNEKVPEGFGNEYKAYFQFKESTQDIRPHRILALNRGEKDQVLKVRLESSADVLMQTALPALADHLLKIAGTPPQPSQPATPPKPTQPEPPAPAPGEPPGTPAPGEPPPEPVSPPAEPTTLPPDVPPSSPPMESPPGESPPMPSSPQEIPLTPMPSAPGQPAELPPSAPPSGLPPPPHAAPLVDSLSTEMKTALTGEPLAEGIDFRSPHAALLKTCLQDALTRLLLPNLEREVRAELTDEAELHAIKICAHNVRSLLMHPPLPGRRVLGIHPGFRNGCKVAALDESGNLLEFATLHLLANPVAKKPKEKDKKPAPAPAPAVAATSAPAEPAPAPGETPIANTAPAPESVPSSEPAPPPAEPVPAPAAEAPPAPEPAKVVDKMAEARTHFVDFVKKHHLNVVAIGNGNGSRDTEAIVADLITTSLPDLSYVVVSEAGASVYASSPIAKEELPNMDAGVRCAVSIGRRLQDPLTELSKTEPQSLAVGLYQHDLGRKELKEILEGVVESCVNQVGIDVNTAGVPLLRFVAGINPIVAREIVEHRKAHGPIASREQLQQVSGMNPARFTQSAAFVRVPASANPLDRTWIHPESYGLAERVITELGFTPAVLDDNAAHVGFRDKLNEVHLEELAQKLDTTPPILDDMFHALAKPGKDPRDDHPPAILKKGMMRLEDLQPGMELKGTVLNVVDFGAFVDVGLKDSGLVHISQMANKYIKSPYDVASVNDVIKVWVLKIDKESNHVSLTMIQPGSDKKPTERAPRPPRREGAAPPQERDQRQDRSRGGPPREGDRRPPQRGRGPRPGGPPRDRPREAPPPPVPMPPRKPKREAPPPKLTKEAIEGKAPLRTLGELAAFFAAKEKKDTPPPAVEEKSEAPPPAVPTPEAKPPETSAEAPPS